MIRALIAFSVFAATLLVQGKVASENLHTRVLCVMPMIGAGTMDDPRRPMFAPNPGRPEEAGQHRPLKRLLLAFLPFSINSATRATSLCWSFGGGAAAFCSGANS